METCLAERLTLVAYVAERIEHDLEIASRLRRM